MLSRPPRISALLLAFLAPFSAACTETPTTTTTTDDASSGLTPALIIRPREFLGDVPCSAAPGAMRSYTATLIDHLSSKDPETGEVVEQTFTFPTSLPTSCGQGVRFDEGVGGHFYSVQIEGYEDFAGDIGPDGWIRSDGTVNFNKLRSGSRHMVNRDGEPVTPRWVTTCGEGENDPTLAAASGTTLIRGCDLLQDVGELGPTAVEIDPLDALGGVACAGTGAAGQPEVVTFDVESLDGLGNTKGLPCKAGLPSLTYTSDALKPGQIVTFRVSGYREGQASAAFGATCSAEVKEGLTVRAACVPLTDKGTLELDWPALLATGGYQCGGDFATYDAVLTLGAKTITEPSVPCEGPTLFSLLPAGPYELDAQVVAKDDKTLFAVHCEGEVVPGETTPVTGCIQQ